MFPVPDWHFFLFFSTVVLSVELKSNIKGDSFRTVYLSFILAWEFSKFIVGPNMPENALVINLKKKKKKLNLQISWSKEDLWILDQLL